MCPPEDGSRINLFENSENSNSAALETERIIHAIDIDGYKLSGV